MSIESCILVPSHGKVDASLLGFE